jgi:UDP-glucose 4-epimerase
MRDGEVLGLDIKPQPYPNLKAISIQGDVTESGDVRSALKGVKAVIHCAAQVSVEKSTQDPLSDARTNVLGTVNMLHEGSLAGVSKFIFVSSAAIFGPPKYIPLDENHPTNPMSNYGASKLAGEKYTLAFAHISPMEVVSVRPFNFYSQRADPESPYSGVITKFLARLKAGQPPIIEGDGRQTRDFIHARDVARMLVIALNKKGTRGEVFNCGSGVPTSIRELADLMIKISKKQLKPEFAAPRVGDIRDSVASTTKASGLLGFRPKTTLEEGLSEMFR